MQIVTVKTGMLSNTTIRIPEEQDIQLIANEAGNKILFELKEKLAQRDEELNTIQQKSVQVEQALNSFRNNLANELEKSYEVAFQKTIQPHYEYLTEFDKHEFLEKLLPELETIRKDIDAIKQNDKKLQLIFAALPFAIILLVPIISFLMFAILSFLQA